jgi:DNA-nicking Smr family endonuclease
VPVLRPAITGPRPTTDQTALPGLDKRTAERLRKGDLAIDGRLDLHGMTQDVAHAALRRFVAESAARGDRVLLVITGKGGTEGQGVLRREVPRWLEQLRPAVLRAIPAQPRHGGAGALYLLLKRRR